MVTLLSSKIENIIKEQLKNWKSLKLDLLDYQLKLELWDRERSSFDKDDSNCTYRTKEVIMNEGIIKKAEIKSILDLFYTSS